MRKRRFCAAAVVLVTVLVGCKGSTENTELHPLCPGIKTMPECLARIESIRQRAEEDEAKARQEKAKQAAEKERADLDDARQRVAVVWSEYDSLPKKTKKDLDAAFNRASGEARWASGAGIGTLKTEIDADYRKRIAPGWTDDCVLAATEDGLERESVWKSTEALDRSVRLAKELDDPANDPAVTNNPASGARQMGEFTKLTLSAATMVDVGTRLSVVERGNGWVRVRGNGAHRAVAGYVEPRQCR